MVSMLDVTDFLCGTRSLVEQIENLRIDLVDTIT